MDALYIYKHSAHDDFEIRHSLRSLAQHMPYVRKVWIFGDKPHFLTADSAMIEHVPHEVTARVLNVKTPVENFFLAMFLSSLIPDLSSEYLLFSDDFYLLQHWPESDTRKDRYLEDMTLQKFRGRGIWVEALWHTYDTLTRLGYHGYNFETHIPAYLTRKRMLNAYCDLKDFITEDRWYGLLGPTSVLNHALRQEKMPLTNLLEEKTRFGFWGAPPKLQDVRVESEGKTFFNFDDLAFGDAIRQFLVERFPEPSKFEA